MTRWIEALRARWGFGGLMMMAAIVWAGVACAASGPLQVRRISPSGADVQPGQEAVIQFDRAMVPLGHMGRKGSEVHVTIRPDPGCQWRWLDTSELACRLPKQHRFAPATRYTVTVGTALKALDDSHLAKRVTRTFTTWRPKVDYTRFQAWTSPVTPVYMVRLNMPVAASELAKHLVFQNQANGDETAVKVEPFTQHRQGPIWSRVPGTLGAVMQIDNPTPSAPLDAHAAAGAPRRVWQVVPVKPLAGGAQYKLRVEKGLRSPLGPLAGKQADAVGEMTTYGAFTFVGVHCDDGTRHGVTVTPGGGDHPRCYPNSFNLLFSSPVPRATLAAVSFSPLPMSAAKLAAIWRDYPQWFLRDRDEPYDAEQPDGYSLTFPLGAMQSYVVTVPAGVKDRFGRTLAKPASATVRTGHRQPFLDPPPREAVLETGQPTIEPLRFTNLSSLDFDYQVFTARDVPHYRGSSTSRSENVLARGDLAVTEDAIVSSNLDIRKLLDGHSGVVWGHLDWSPNGPYRPYSLLAEVTPWQVLAKVGHYGTLVWVNRWDSGQPVAGAKVWMMHGNHGALDSLDALGASATTNARGLAELQGANALPASWFRKWKDESNFYVGVTRRDDVALLPLDGTFERTVGDASHYAFWSRTAPPNGHLRAWAVTEEGIYKPGSDVQYAAFVRAEGKATLEAPPALDYTLTITDPEGNSVLKRDGVKLSAFGETNGKLHISANAPMGWYDITIEWPTSTGDASRLAGRFLVTDFVPASFKVRTLVEGTRFGPGDKVATRVSATLHAGGPYTAAKVKFTTRLVPEPFSPDTPVAAGFSFDSGNADASAKTLAVTDGKLDRTGHASTTLTLPAEAGKIMYGKVAVEGAVASARAKWIANAASVPYSARDRFVGLRTRDWMQQATKPFKVEYLVVDPAGQPAAGSKVELDLQRQTITRVRVKNGAGDFGNEEHTKWVTVDTCKAVSATAPGTCAMTAPSAGSYQVVAKVIDTHGHSQSSTLSTWVTGAGEVVWSSSGKGVTLVPDKTSYRVGDVAHVLVQNPYPGARALVTIERYGVLWKKIVTLKGSAPVIDVPIGAKCFPGAYLSVAIFSPRASPPANPDLGRPEVALGYVALPVSGKGSSLAVAVKPAKATYKPRQTVDVNVAVTDHAGKAAANTRLVVAVVDQGVLDLIAKGKQYYDPRETFYAPPNGPDVTNYSLTNQLLTQLQPKVGKGQNPGGGGGESSGPNVRSNFAYAAYWNPALTTNAQGHAHFSFKLPDNLTRWRILVIAVQPGAAMGLDDGSVRVNLPLQIEPALPNQMHVGDAFGAAFNVTNRTQNPLQVMTRIEAGGAIAGGTAKVSGKLSLASFAHGLSWLQLTASRPGDITLTGTATSGKLGDAVEAHIPVKRAGTEVVAAEYGSTVGAGAEVPVKVPAKAVPGTAKVSVRFAPTLIGGLTGAFEVMRDDPLRTWEVRLSRGVLASDYLRLKPVLGNAVAWPDATDTIGKMLQSAADFQAPNGGMAFWIPNNRFVSPYLSVYTALAFDWLGSAGHTPPAAVQQKLRGYLHQEILAKTGADAAAPVLRAGALAALAMAPGGKLPKGAVAGMLPKLHQLRLFGQALLLDAAIASGDRASADAIVKSIMSYAEESAGEISFNQREQGVYAELLATPLRSNCAILDSLSRYEVAWGVQPLVDDPLGQLARWVGVLAGARTGGTAGADLVGTTPQKSLRWVADRRRDAGGWPNSQENVFCTTAITHYADAFETPVKALTGKLELPGQAPQQTTFGSRAAPAVKLAGPAAKPGQSFQVKLGRSGQGRLYYGVQVHYAMPPDALPAADAGFTLSRHYFVQRGDEWAPVKSGTVLKRGDIVRVELVVDAPTERHHVALTDPLPGAFEAVNRLLATAAMTTPAKQPGVSVLMFDGGAWPNMSIVTGGFYHRETHFDAVRFFADDLPAGHYRVVYAAQVIAPGKFIAPAPTIKEIYQPDVFGRGLPQHLDVAMPGH